MSKITIIGSGLSGHFTAMTLQFFKPDVEYEIINDENTPTIGVGESGILDLPTFLFEHAKVDINEFYQEVHPVHKMGINFRDWIDVGFNYNYTFDSGMVKNIFNVNDYILGPQNTTLSCYMIENNLSPITNDSSIYNTYSYQIDNLKFVSFLKKIAMKRGIKYINKKVIGVELEKEKNIKNLILEGNEKYESDFYIDCSGFNSVIAKTLNLKFKSFKKNLPCDYAVVGQHDISLDEIKSYTVSTRKPYGWQWEIDTSERAGKGYVFCSDFTTQEKAIEQFKSDNPKIKTPRIIPFPTGKYEDICGENYLLNGNSQGFAEPLESTGFSAVFVSTRILTTLLNKSDLKLNETKQKTINDYINKFWNFIVDFLTLHYKYNSPINNNGFWEYCNNELKLSDNLMNIINFCKENEIDNNLDSYLNQYWLGDPIFNTEGIYVHLNARNLMKFKPNLYYKDQVLESFKKVKNLFLKETQLIDFGYNSIDFSKIIFNKKYFKDFT